MGALHDDVLTLLMISRQILFRMRNISNKKVKVKALPITGHEGPEGE